MIDARRRASVQVLEGPVELETLRTEWRALRTDFPGPGNHLDWWIAFAHAPPDRTRPCVVVLRDEGQLVGIAPLFRRRGPAGTMGMINSDDASGFLYRDPASLAALVDAVIALRRPLGLRSLVAGSPTGTQLIERSRAAGRIVLHRPWSMGPSLVVDDRFADPLARLPAKQRGELRRRLRRAAERGQVGFHVDPVGDDATQRFAEFVRVEGSGWKGREGTSLEWDTAQREQLLRFVTAPEVRARVRFASMRLDGAAIAVNLVVVSDRRLWTLKDGYDETFARFAPGTLLRLHLMAWAADEGLERIEFMGRMDDWKRSWGEGLTLHAVRTYPATARGVMALGADAATRAARLLGPRLRTSMVALRRRPPAGHGPGGAGPATDRRG